MNPIVADTPEAEKETTTPGVLRGAVWLRLHTRQSGRLIHGRSGNEGKPAIIGLAGFADRLKPIWQAAQDDDPYADWWLIRIHETLEQTRTLIRQQQAQTDQQLAAAPAMEVQIAASLTPCRVPLRFATPFAYQAARLIGEFDSLACALLTGRYIGLLDPAEVQRCMHEVGRRIRGLLALPLGYRRLGIDRETVRSGGRLAERAQRLMGVLPETVLNGEVQPPLAPKHGQPPKGVSQKTVAVPLSQATGVDSLAFTKPVSEQLTIHPESDESGTEFSHDSD